MEFQTVKQVAELLGAFAFNLHNGQAAILKCRLCGAVVVRGGIATATNVSKDGRPVLREALKPLSLSEALDELIKLA